MQQQRQHLYDQLHDRQVVEVDEILEKIGCGKAWSEMTKEEVSALYAMQDRHLSECRQFEEGAW